LAWWFALFGLYLLMASQLNWAEAAVGAVAASLGTTAALVTASAGKLRFQPRARWLAVLGRLPMRVLTDCVTVGGELWRRLTHRDPVEGAFRVIEFDPGRNGPVSAARRAMIVAGASLAPNSYVVAVDRKRGVLLLHQLVSAPDVGNKEWPL
jgi:hypothetical protein